MREVGLQAEPEGADLQESESDEGDNAGGERDGGWSANKMEQTQEAPARDEDGKDGLGLCEISGNDASDTEKEEPDEGHDEKPEGEDSRCRVRAPGSTLAEGYEDNTGGQDLNHVAQWCATDEANKNEAKD